MITYPSVLAFVSASFLVILLILYADWVGMEILLGWDRNSLAERQLKLERKTYLVSTILFYAMWFELLSLFLYIAVADQLHTFFNGAMCAAGTLSVNDYGYLTLLLKIISFLLCSLWLILNHLDNQFPDYPLLRIKYGLLLPYSLLLIGETISGTLFFAELDPEIITSCCGVIFAEDQEGIVSELIHFPGPATCALFFTAFSVLAVCGFRLLRTANGGCWYALCNLLLLPVSLAALISFFCLYFYELPTHHCPFCLLQKEYDYVGYLLYFSLFGGVVFGLGVGGVSFFRRHCSITKVFQDVQKRLCLTSLLAHSLFVALVCWRMLFSEFHL